LGFNWDCAFLWFSRRYALFSAPVIGATVLVMAFYAAVAFLIGWFAGRNWRASVLVFGCAPVMLAAVVLRLHLLR
jgi:hypothetical protein